LGQSHMIVRKAVIPTAGAGTRLLTYLLVGIPQFLKFL